MRLDRLGSIRQRQSGLTLVELMIAIALAGIVTAGITMLISNVFATSARTSNHMTAVRQVQHAGKQVSQDILMAQAVDTESEFLKLTWTDPATDYEHEVIYSLVDMPSGGFKRLQRILKITPPEEEPTTTVSVVAQYIDPDLGRTSCTPEVSLLPKGEILAFRVTATVAGQSETRVYEVKPRPG